MEATGNRHRVLALAIVLFAFALRAYDLGALPPALYTDESYNILDALRVASEGNYPIFFAENFGREPLYIYLQTLVVYLAGTSPFAIRFASALLGTLAVAITYPLVRRLLARDEPARRETVALIATFLLAALMWHLSFSRIGLRAIALPVLEALAVYLFYRAVHAVPETGPALPSGGQMALPSIFPRCWLWFALSGLATGLALYTYLSSRLLPFVIGALVVAGLCSGRPLTRTYGAGLGLLGLTFAAAVAPLAVYFAQHPADFGGRESVSLLNYGGLPALGQNLLRVGGMFNWIGDHNWRHNLPYRPAFDPIVGLFFLAGIALAIVRLRATWRKAGGLSGYLAPVLIVPAMLLPSLLSESAPHFLRSIGVLPFLLIFPALGLEAAWRAAAGWFRSARYARAGLVLVLALSAGATIKAYFVDFAAPPGSYYEFGARYVEMARYLGAQDPDVRIYLSAQMENEATIRLFSSARSFVPFDARHTIVLSPRPALYGIDARAGDRGDPAGFESRLPLALKAQVERLPDRFGQPSFVFYRMEGGAAPAVELSLSQHMPVGPLEPAGDLPGALLTFGEQLTLLGVQVGPQRERAAGDHTVAAGVELPVTMAWKAQRPVADDYSVSLRLMDKNGRAWAQADRLLGGQTYPTGLWDEQDIVLDGLVLDLPADLPPGNYRLAVGAYSAQSARTLAPRLGGRPIGELGHLTSIYVERPAPSALAAMRPAQSADAPFGADIRLLGYDFDRDSYKPGETVGLDLYWRASRDVARDLAVDLRLGDSLGAIVARRRAPPVNGDYPTARWRAGDALRDSHRLVVGPSVSAGPSRLVVALVDAATGAVLGEAEVAGPALVERQRDFALPKPGFPLDVELGQAVDLLGFDLDAPSSAPIAPRPSFRAGSQVPVTLYWRDRARLAGSYTVFVQLLDAEGTLVAQHDGLPLGGDAPTSSWLPGEVITDRHVVSLPVDLPSADYTLIAGLYDALDGKRMPVGGSDFARLGTIQVRR